jgi:predicted DNA-binding mobile mystery protein A
MSTTELAGRLGISQSGIPDLEQREVEGSIRMNTLERVADALDCDVAYFLVPRTTLDETVSTQARNKAKRLVTAVAQHSRLEDQEVAEEDTSLQVDEIAATLIDRRGLWSPIGPDA